MKKFIISANELLYYQRKEVKAENENEAKEKYFEMIATGDVEVCKSDYCDVKIKK